MGLRVIGAGFGRTGTRSLKTALEELGFDRCYHMVEVMKNPGHLKEWGTIMQGGRADWDNLFQGYQAATDWPAAAYYRDLMQVYPDAKVILTVRDPERWHVSIMNTIYQLSRKFRRYTRIFPSLHGFLKGMEMAVWQDIFHNRVEDPGHAMAVFNRHIEQVKRDVPPERLLIFEARHGWEPLCEFLGVPVPAGKPYPHKNKGAVIQRVLKYGTPLKWGAVAVLAALAYLMARAFIL